MKGLALIYKQFMNGFTYIIPLAVVGGVFLKLFENTQMDVFFTIGSIALFLVYPIITAFIAYGISDRPGLIIGLIGGALITTGSSGFIGAILMGFFTGYLIHLFQFIFKKFPVTIKGLLPVFIYPVIGALCITLFYLGVNFAITPINTFISQAYENLSLIAIMIFAVILSIMMVYDLGGPINKIAYVIGVSSILNGTANVLMTAIMIAGMIPPLAIAIATSLFKSIFSEEETKHVHHKFLMGIAFISEGALPFKKKYNNSTYLFIVGAIISSLLVVYFNVESNIAHGGILALFFIDAWIYFLLTLVGSSLFTAILLGFFLPKNKKTQNV